MHVRMFVVVVVCCYLKKCIYISMRILMKIFNGYSIYFDGKL